MYEAVNARQCEEQQVKQIDVKLKEEGFSSLINLIGSKAQKILSWNITLTGVVLSDLQGKTLLEFTWDVLVSIEQKKD